MLTRCSSLVGVELCLSKCLEEHPPAHHILSEALNQFLTSSGCMMALVCIHEMVGSVNRTTRPVHMWPDDTSLARRHG